MQSSAVRRIASISLLFSLLCAAPTQAAEGYADVRPEPGGPRLFCIDGDAVRPDPAGKRLLFIDDDTLRPEPGGKRLLFIDSDDVRPEPGGIRLAFFDDKELRRSPGGPVLLYLDGDTIRDTFGGKRLLFLDGGPLTRPQLVAALYHWKPELFQLSAAEQAALKAEMEKNAKEAELAAKSKLLGHFQVLNSSAPAFKDATIDVAKVGDYFTATLNLTGDQKWYGIAMPRKVNGEEEYWIAASPTGAIGLGIYELQGAELKGKWTPLAVVTEGAEVLGEETATGAANFTGNYTVTAGKFTMKLGDYSGKLALAAFPPDNASVALSPRTLLWTVGGKSFGGVGTVVEYEPGKHAMIAAASAEKVYFVGRLKETSSSGVHLDVCTNMRNTGFILLNKSAP